MEAVVRGAPARLNDGGMLQVLANWAHIGDQPWPERLATWVEETGCDLWVVEREHLDVCEYIETSLTDAGLDGSAQWRSRYDEMVVLLRRSRRHRCVPGVDHFDQGGPGRSRSLLRRMALAGGTTDW